LGLGSVVVTDKLTVVRLSAKIEGAENGEDNPISAQPENETARSARSGQESMGTVAPRLPRHTSRALRQVSIIIAEHTFKLNRDRRSPYCAPRIRRAALSALMLSARENLGIAVKTFLAAYSSKND
jgi:hypothetical protein